MAGLDLAMVLAGVWAYLDFTAVWYFLSGNERWRWIGEVAFTENTDLNHQDVRTIIESLDKCRPDS